jgi:quinone-modifying oxidoreductase subunit QmoC
MPVRANPRLVDDLQLYGAEDVSKCFHCGNCTAACQLATEPHIFPRKSMRALQMGLQERLRGGLEPWLCYYCGDCSEQCPRGADPGETMMAMRRWLTGQYDFTGIARAFYRSPKFQIIVMAAMALATGVAFVAYGLLREGGGNLSVYDGPGAFLPVSAVHIFDWTMAGMLVVLLGANCIRMWWFTMRGPNAVPVPLSLYLRNIMALPIHFITQRRYSQCKNRHPWVLHLALMLGYVTMLVLIVFFLGDMQYGPEIRWGVHAFGYAAAAALLVASILLFRGRLRKEAAYQQHSQPSDWIFLGGIIVLTVTGILQHILHRAGFPAAANVAYIVHLMGVAPFEICMVPFGKWAHLAYRPLAIYFAAVQQAALAAAAAQPEKSVTALRAS